MNYHCTSAQWLILAERPNVLHNTITWPPLPITETCPSPVYVYTQYLASNEY